MIRLFCRSKPIDRSMIYSNYLVRTTGISPPPFRAPAPQGGHSPRSIGSCPPKSIVNVYRLAYIGLSSRKTISCHVVVFPRLPCPLPLYALTHPTEYLCYERGRYSDSMFVEYCVSECLISHHIPQHVPTPPPLPKLLN